MATTEFDYDRWPADLRALAAARDEAMRAFLDQMEDTERRSRFKAASGTFREAHREWLREHPDRIPGLIAHRLREQRRSRIYVYGDYETARRIRDAERAEIDELWQLHHEAVPGQVALVDDNPAPALAPERPHQFTIEVTNIRNGYRTTAFGVFDTIEQAETLADQWRQDAHTEGLTDLFVTVREIADVSAYPAWIAPERRRVAQERAEQDLTAYRTRLLLEFHDDEAIKELTPQLIADAVTQTGRFEIACPDDAVPSYRSAAHAAGRLLGKPLAITERRCAEGTVLTAVVKTVIDLNQYRAKHGRTPRGPGSWTLRKKDTGEELTLNGTWGEVRAKVPGGDWTLRP